MLGKIAAKLATKVRGRKKPKAPHPSSMDNSENLKILAERKKAGLTPDGKPKRKGKKRKPDTKKQTAAGRLAAGAGDMSEPGGSGKFRAGQKSRRSSSATTSNQAMSTAESGRLARGKAARGSKAFYDQAVKDKAAGKKLTAAQKDTLKNYNKEMRPASPKRKVSKKKSEEAARKATTLNLKKYKKGGKVAAADWMQGLSQKEIDEILGNPTRDASGVKRHTKRKKNKPHKKKVVMRTAKAGGQVVKKAGGGKMSHVGLYPAEESRSGTMSEKKRATHMKRGGQVHRNTSRENRLEELGRVDAEKAHTKKGKSNLRAEKKRIVKELNGNDFVASHYD